MSFRLYLENEQWRTHASSTDAIRGPNRTNQLPSERGAKVDYLAKIDAATLIARGTAKPPQQIKGCINMRGIDEIMQNRIQSSCSSYLKDGTPRNPDFCLAKMR
ncbi:hypothetical protein BX600DRAFT_448895 [Xylariales sp. PMI_506]|nr:hypothetical protein BX600DRAFT_448895 [Xylariales sp. PMI_506]